MGFDTKRLNINNVGPHSGSAVFTALFDRFESDHSDPNRLAADLADMLSGRRAFSRRDLGVLSWGMPSLHNVTAKSEKDRERIANYIADTIERFEPRLTNIKVTPVANSANFSFVIDAQFVKSDASRVRLRILSPVVGGGLGANVVVLDVNPGTMQAD